MKKVMLAALLLMVSSTVFAGSIDYLSNQSAKYIMDVARNASTDGADIVAYNPAGTALMGQGFFIDVSNQSLWKPYSQTDYNGTAFETFKQDAPTPILPNVFAVYNFGTVGTGNLAVYAQVGIVAGGGALNDGALKWDGVAGTDAIPGGASVKVSSVYYAEGLGVSYSLLDNMISISLGGKVVEAVRTADIETASWGVDQYNYNATGFTGVVGLDVRPLKELTLAVTYQTETNLNAKYSDQIITTPAFFGLPAVDGLKNRQDLPQILLLGAEYAVTPDLSVSVCSEIYFLSAANLGRVQGPGFAGTNPDLNSYFGTGWEVGLGATYKVIDPLKIGGSVMYTDQGAKSSLATDSNAESYESANPVLNSWYFSIGATYTVIPNLDITLAGGWTYYLPKTATISGSSDQVSYSKNVYTLAIGVGYKI